MRSAMLVLSLAFFTALSLSFLFTTTFSFVGTRSRNEAQDAN
jgi:hypothetical protein